MQHDCTTGFLAGRSGRQHRIQGIHRLFHVICPFRAYALYIRLHIGLLPAGFSLHADDPIYGVFVYIGI